MDDQRGDGVTDDVDAVDERGTGWQDQLPLDEPVPYRLTSRGRRAVDPTAVPRLRVVGDAPAHVDLDELDGTARVRARALRRTGMHTLDIAEELDVEPLHVQAWVGDLPVPAGAGARRRHRQLRAVDGPADARDEEPPGAQAQRRCAEAAEAGREEAEARLAAVPELRVGLGILSGVLEPDHHALVLAGEHLPLVAAAWQWVTTVLDADPTAARVLVHHDPGGPGDIAAREAAVALDLDLSRVTTTRDAQRRGRAPLVRLRVSGSELAGRVIGWQRALLAEVSRGAG